MFKVVLFVVFKDLSSSCYASVVPGLEGVVNNLKHCVNGEVYNSTLRENHNWIRVKIVTFDKRSFQ